MITYQPEPPRYLDAFTYQPIVQPQPGQQVFDRKLRQIVAYYPGMESGAQPGYPQGTPGMPGGQPGYPQGTPGMPGGQPGYPQGNQGMNFQGQGGFAWGQNPEEDPNNN